MSQSDGIPRGLFEPVSCRNVRCTSVSPAITNGRRKWRAKNRVNVGLSTEKPPQAHSTRVCPTYGIAENRLVMTVAPQKDICPQGSTYPTKAVAIRVRRRMTPMFQVSLLRYEP